MGVGKSDAPYALLTANIDYRMEPDGRGTFSILKSCIITLALCSYTALHLNVPPGNATPLSLFWRKAKWIVVGIFAPEIMVYIAWGQKQRVKALSRDLAEIFEKVSFFFFHLQESLFCSPLLTPPKTETDPSDGRKNDWTITHSWFAYMGGFALDTKQGQDDLPGEYMAGSPRLALNHKAIRIVARLGWLPDISKDAIRDKSKADGFAKILVMTQATWLILQCVMRAVHRLPITTLELNTLAHAICALLMYIIWWDKPLDINEPTILSGEWAPGLAATFAVCSRRNLGSWLDSGEPEIKTMAWIRPSVLRGLPLAYPHGNSVSKYVVLAERYYQHTWWDVHDLSTPGRSPYRGPGAHVDIARFAGVGVTWLKCPPPNVIHLSDLLRWQLFSSFVNESPDVAAELFCNKPPPEFGSNLVSAISPDHKMNTNDPQSMKSLKTNKKPKKKDHPSRVLARAREASHSALQNVKTTSFHFTLNSEVNGETLVRDYIATWPSTTFGISASTSNKNKWKPRLASLCVFGIVAVIYGSIHAAAWNDHFHFPTAAEALLWKVSCVYIAGSGCLAMILVTTGVVGWAVGQSMRVNANSEQEQEPSARPSGDPSSNTYQREGIPDSDSDCADTFVGFIFGFIFCIAGSLFILFSVVIGASLVFYFLCRGFLVVEGFVGLRSLPRDIFRTPDWTQYLPHL